VKTADIGIEDINVNKEEISREFFEKSPFTDDFTDDLIESGNNKIPIIKTIHTVYNEDNIEILDNDGKVKKEIFELDNEESVGTQKFFKMSAPILNTLQKGKILIIDELDASLHPMLTKHLIKLFSNKEINTKNAQLIFATHDTNLLKPQIFKRDQIWFTEKDKYGSTTLYSILEIKGVRANDDFEKQYIQGKYGAVPYLGKFEF
jgi:AAA15 family ATPase/GTPase